MERIFFLLLNSILTIVATVIALLIFIQDYNNSVSVERTLVDRAGPGQVWAVLVAGSRGWDNYRHQADVCHAYQVLHRHGVSDENMIVMMYDDIAYSADNPHKGAIYNQPGGENVYAGVKKDYTGEDVTAENFLAVLKGNKAAMEGKGSGKVLDSGPNDEVFIYFADHGAYGMVSFPHDFLSAQTLGAALKTMHENQRYKQILFYLEACESGSMFQQLPGDIGVLAFTASNATAPSFAAYYDPTLETFLADVFSISWLDDSESGNHRTERILDQIEAVAKKTSSYSVSSVYGDKKIEAEVIGLFQGDQASTGAGEKLENISNPVESYEVPLARLLVNKEKNKRKIEALLQQRNEIELTFERIQTAIAQHFHASDDQEVEIHMDCYYSLISAIHHHCYNLGENSFALRKLKSLGMFCVQEEFSHFTLLERIEIIKERIEEVCNHSD